MQWASIATGAFLRAPTAALSQSVRDLKTSALRFCEILNCEFLGPVHGRTYFSRIFVFELSDFFADFLAGFLLLIFVRKSGQKNYPRKSPAKSSKINTTKIPETFLQRGRAKSLPLFCRNLGLGGEGVGTLAMWALRCQIAGLRSAVSRYWT